VIESAWLAVPNGIVIRKSMYPAPLIVFDADAFAVTPAPSSGQRYRDRVRLRRRCRVVQRDRKTNVVPPRTCRCPSGTWREPR